LPAVGEGASGLKEYGWKVFTAPCEGSTDTFNGAALAPPNHSCAVIAGSPLAVSGNKSDWNDGSYYNELQLV